MHPFQIGDIVVCIDDKPLPRRELPKGCQWIEASRAYRIKGVLHVPEANGTEYGVELEEVPNPCPRGAWHAWRFRKIECADDGFVGLLRSLRANALFKEAVRQTVAWHRRRWAAPGGFVQGRAEHVERLLTGYGEWFRDIFACYPDAAHIRIIADRMFTWRSVPTAETKGMNPWIVPADFPALCRVALSDCATNKGVGHA